LANIVDVWYRNFMSEIYICGGGGGARARGGVSSNSKEKTKVDPLKETTK
jgi:hypothetical protein